MTTIVVVRKNGVAAIAADSLTTFGDMRLSSDFDVAHDKIMRCGDSYLGLAGSAAHQLVLENLIARNAKMKLGSRADIYESFRKMHPVLKEECFLNPKEEEDDPYESSQITALIANPSGIFGVFSMREIFEYKKFWAIGSGREYALGAMHTVYDQDLSAEEIARIGIEAGIAFDINSALPASLYTVKLKKKHGTA
ncbi:MAG: MFS transporter [Sulfuricella sp.]|nr:MFS transporter [Sulfuricella sp.]